MDKHQDHSRFHSKNAFCASAGPEENKHLQSLLNGLTDSEIAQLVDKVGIKFDTPTNEVDRDTLEGVVDEASRENFYRSYQEILKARDTAGLRRII